MSYVLFSSHIPTMSENAMANTDFYRWQSNAKALIVGRSRAPCKFRCCHPHGRCVCRMFCSPPYIHTHHVRKCVGKHAEVFTDGSRTRKPSLSGGAVLRVKVSGCLSFARTMCVFPSSSPSSPLPLPFPLSDFLPEFRSRIYVFKLRLAAIISRSKSPLVPCGYFATPPFLVIQREIK